MPVIDNGSGQSDCLWLLCAPAPNAETVQGRGDLF